MVSSVQNSNLSTAEKLYELSSDLYSPSLTVGGKLESLKEIQDTFINSENSRAGGGNFISLESNSTGTSTVTSTNTRLSCGFIHLPNFEWGNFRKGYTILAWIRPNEVMRKMADAKKGRSIDKNSETNGILFNLSHGERLGVTATLENINYDSDAHALTCQLQIQTFSHGFKTSHISGSSTIDTLQTRTSSVSFRIPASSYSLLTISHTHPYLKQSQIFISVNHQLQLQQDLFYPFSSQILSSQSNHQDNNFPLNNNILFKNLPIECSMIALLKESLMKEKSDVIFPNLISEAGPSSSTLLFQSGILVPPVPPQRDALVAPFSKKFSTPLSISSNISSSSSFTPPRGSSSYNISTSYNSQKQYSRSLGTPICVHPNSVELQNNISRSLLLFYNFETAQTLGKEKKIYVPPCINQNVGIVENIGFVTNPTLQRRESQISRNHHLPSGTFVATGGNGGTGGNDFLGNGNVSGNSISSTSIWLNDKYTKYYAVNSSLSPSSSLLCTSGLLFSYILPFHLALYPHEGQLSSSSPGDDKISSSTKDSFAIHPKLYSERQGHFRDLIADEGKFAKMLLIGIAELLHTSWSCREEAVQTGFVYTIATYITKLLDQLKDISTWDIDYKERCIDNLESGLEQIVKVCCGELVNEDPLRRTSDLALACVFGLTLNYRILSLFSFHINESPQHKKGLRRNKILEHIATAYQHYGHLLRENISPQILLDEIQILFHSIDTSFSPSTTDQFELLLTALLQSSLSSKTHISRSEIDVQACIQALANTELGSLLSGVILRVLNKLKSRRLARNLWLGEYPKIIAPVILSRSVVKGQEERTNNELMSNTEDEDGDGWRKEWRLAFELYVWLISIPGSEGQIIDQSINNFLFESSKAGSLNRCINEDFAKRLFEPVDKIKELALYLTPEERRQEETFLSDAHANRIRALLPLLPALVISVLTPFHRPALDTTKQEIAPVLTTLFGGIDLTLVELTGSVARKPQNHVISTNIFFNLKNNQGPVDYAMINHKRTLAWIPILISVINLLRTYEVEHHTDWIDVDNSETDIETKEFHIKSCIDLILDSIASLLISSMRIGGKTTVAALQSLKSCPYLTRVIYMTLHRCIRINLQSFSKAMSTGISRVCLFLEEHLHLEWEMKLNWVLIEILQRGREEFGWYQIANTTVPLPSSEEHASTNVREKASLRKKLTQFVDENLLQASSEIYHTLVTDDVTTISSFERGSILFLPILQPTLRIVFNIMSNLSSDVKYISDKSLLEHVCKEVDQSVTAALVGLSFANARDIGLSCIASLRNAISVHKSDNDLSAVTMLETLLLKVARELRERHHIEKKSKYAAQYHAYIEGEEDGKNSKAVEDLILGSDSLPEDHQDFILYPESLTPSLDKNNIKSKAILGWSKYLGLSDALDQCFEFDDDANAELIFHHLNKFLDEWDANIENEKEGMVSLFDNMDSEIYQIQDHQSNDAVGDAAVHYIELSGAEKQRIKDVEEIFINLVGQCEWSASRICWAHWMESFSEAGGESLEWERSLGERGGKDIYSHLGTCWIAPQFPKFIPDYLDHSKPIQPLESITAEDILDGEFNLGGKVEIVDITKKNFFEDDSCNSDGEGSLGFPEVSNIEDVGESELNVSDDLNDSNVTAETKKNTSNQKNRSPSSPPFRSNSVHSSISLSQFSLPPDTSPPHEASQISNSDIERYFDNVLHIRPEGSRKGVLFVTKTHIIIEYYSHYYEGEIMAMEEARNRKPDGVNKSQDDMIVDEKDDYIKSINTFGRPNSCRYLLNEITHAYLRRYRLRDSAIELFFLSSGGSSCFFGSSSLFLDFGPGKEGNSRRDSSATHIMRCAPQNSVKQYPEKSQKFIQEQLHQITKAWIQGSMSNFDYLMQLNIISGRSFNDLCQYPVMPWVLSNYSSTEIPDLNDPDNFRDLTKPMGALNSKRLAEFVERFETFSDPTIPPFMYGSHYSTSAGVVLHFLVRLHPFAGLHRQLQSGHFDVADRLFCNVQRTWETCTGASVSEVKELTPEWYSNPAFLKNCNNFQFGTSQEGNLIGDVQLPPWAGNSPEKFIEVMRCAMESSICSSMLPDWIDLIFGFKQQGPASIQANNVFFYLTYYGSIDISAIPDEDLRIATELQIAHFGQCPMQLFWRPHVRKLPSISFRRNDCMSNYLHLWSQPGHHEHPKLFGNSPMSHWCHLPPPPPGPHADLICVRACLGNRCVGIDSRGVLHFFKWIWKPDDDDYENENGSDVNQSTQVDRGCFVAHRELSNFRSLPQLPINNHDKNIPIAVAISNHLYLKSSHVLVLSDADGCGGLSMQFVDPKKGVIKTETIIPCIHSSRISAIAMDSVGMRSSKNSKGQTGEIAIIGSEDGTATLWRFIFNSYIPFRPRLRMRGHYGQKIYGVAVNCFLNVCATISKKRCCIFHLGNGTLMRSFAPPIGDNSGVEVSFADTKAISLSIQGFIIVICKSVRKRTITYSLELYNLEGVHCGSRPFESFFGVPRKMTTFADGKAVSVCGGCGVSVHRISNIQPLEKLEEWRITNQDIKTLTNSFLGRKIPTVYDLDFYPNIQSLTPPYYARPCVAMVGCSDGILQIHALSGISNWASANQNNSMSSVVGNVLVKPANTIKTAVGTVKGFGTRFIGFGKEIGREVGGAISSGVVASTSGSLVGGILRKSDR